MAALDARLLAVVQAVGADIKKLFARKSTIIFVIDGGGVAIAVGQIVDLPDVPAACTIIGWTITSDASTTSVVDIQRATYANFPTFTSIAGTDKPTLTTAQKAQDTTLTGWGNTALVLGDCLRAIVSSNNNAKRLTITLRVQWS